MLSSFPQKTRETLVFRSKSSRQGLLTRLPPNFATENQLRDPDSSSGSLPPLAEKGRQKQTKNQPNEPNRMVRSVRAWDSFESFGALNAAFFVG
jgi:hypothetical protein